MKRLFLLFFSLISIHSFAQNEFDLGIYPKIDLNTKYKKWKFHFIYQDENIFLQKIENQEIDVHYKHYKSVIRGIITHKIGVFSALGGGYSYDIVSHKQLAIQQFIHTKESRILTHSHRFRVDEQFYESKFNNLTTRYQLSLSKSLNGYSLEPREFYTKLTFEQLLIYKNQHVDFDSVEGIYLGYYFSNKDKIELGTMLKSEHLLENSHTYKLWLNVNWYLSF